MRSRSASPARLGDATTLTREALRAAPIWCVAVGGDGTINEVVNGFFDGERPGPPRGAAFGVLPAGTGGDFIKTLGIPRDTFAAAARAQGGPPRTIDVGRLTLRRPRRQAGAAPLHQHRLASASRAWSTATSTSRPSALGGTVSFVLGHRCAPALPTRTPRVRITLDGGDAARRQHLQRRGGQRPLLRRRHEGRARRRARRRHVRRRHARRLRLRRSALPRPRHLQRQAPAQPEGHGRARARKVEADAARRQRGAARRRRRGSPGRLPASFEIMPGALQLRQGLARDAEEARRRSTSSPGAAKRDRPPVGRARISARSVGHAAVPVAAPTSTSGRSPGSRWCRCSSSPSTSDEAAGPLRLHLRACRPTAAASTGSSGSCSASDTCRSSPRCRSSCCSSRYQAITFALVRLAVRRLRDRLGAAA